MLAHHNQAPSAPSRVVILGRNGFVPAALRVKFEALGWRLLVLGSESLDLTLPNSAKRLAEAIAPDDAVVMASALTPEKGKDTATLIRNLQMAQTVAAALASRPCAHLLYYGSDSVYGWDTSVIDEATPPSPDNLYGVMHLARELALREAMAKAGVPFCVLRPCAIFGTGDTHNAYGPNRFVRTAFSDGRIELFGTGEDTRDHVHIDDVATITRHVLERRTSGLLNLTSGKAVAFARVAGIIQGLMPRKISIVTVSRAGAATHRSFTTAVRSGAFPEFAPTPLSDGLARLVSEHRAI